MASLENFELLLVVGSFSARSDYKYDKVRSAIKSVLRQRHEEVAAAIAFSDEHRLFDSDWKQTILPDLFCHRNVDMYPVLELAVQRQQALRCSKLERQQQDDNNDDDNEQGESRPTNVVAKQKFACIIDAAKPRDLLNPRFDDVLATLCNKDDSFLILTFPKVQDVTQFFDCHSKRLKALSSSSSSSSIGICIVDTNIGIDNLLRNETDGALRVGSHAMWQYAARAARAAAASSDC